MALFFGALPAAVLSGRGGGSGPDTGGIAPPATPTENLGRNYAAFDRGGDRPLVFTLSVADNGKAAGKLYVYSPSPGR